MSVNENNKIQIILSKKDKELVDVGASFKYTFIGQEKYQ